MPDIIDLLKIGKTDPGSMINVINNEEEIARYTVTSKDLEVIRTMEADTIRVIVDSIENRINRQEVAGTNACPGTFACFDSSKIAEAKVKGLGMPREL